MKQESCGSILWFISCDLFMYTHTRPLNLYCVRHRDIARKKSLVLSSHSYIITFFFASTEDGTQGLGQTSQVLCFIYKAMTQGPHWWILG